jgi:hypothetical protein
MPEDALMEADEEDGADDHADSHELSIQDVKANMPPMDNETAK